jgi:hypothetical protein
MYVFVQITVGAYKRRGKGEKRSAVRIKKKKERKQDEEGAYIGILTDTR